jgi:Fe(3+) dicitrate transport protein
MSALWLAVLVTQIPDAGIRQTTVTAKRNDVRWVAGSAQVISNEELTRHESNDLHRVLDGVPGVYVREEDGFGLRPNIGLRGASSDRSSKVTLLEDGVLFGPAPYSAPAAYYTPLVTRMVGVEIYKGPSAIRFGPQTIGGAINLRTRAVPVGTEGDIDVSLGSYGTNKLHAVFGTGNETLGILIEGVHLGSEGFKTLDTGGNTGFDKNELMGKARFQFGNEFKQSLEFKVGFANETSNETYLGLSAADFIATPFRRYGVSAFDQMNFLRTQMNVKHRLQFESFDVETNFYRHDFARTWKRLDSFANGPALDEVLRNPSGRNQLFASLLNGTENSTNADEQLILARNQRTFVSQGIQSIAHTKWNMWKTVHELELGFRFHHDDIERHHTGQAYAINNGQLVNGSNQFDLVINNAFTRSIAMHVTDSISLGNLLIVPGVRMESYESSFVDRLNPSSTKQNTVTPLFGLGALYSFDFGATAFGGIHQGMSALSPSASVVSKPEVAVNSELGFRFAKSGIKVEATGFWSEYQNITAECTGSSGCVGDDANQQFNGGAARTLGVEIAASLKKSIWKDLSGAIDASWTMTNSQFLTNFVSANPSWGNVRNGDVVPYVPGQQGLVRLRANKGIFEVGVGAHFVGEMRELAGQGDTTFKVPSRLIFDANASLNLGDASIYFTATNLTNQTSVVATRPFGARPQAPLMVNLGFKYSFR